MSNLSLDDAVAAVTANQPVLIAGPTASGKSALALRIAQKHGGVIINADASQVYSCWRVLTARPSTEDESIARHVLYGHVPSTYAYSTGHWLREVQPILTGASRPIIVGGTGLYFTALTEGLAEIPATPAEVRSEGDALSREEMLNALDSTTRDRIDTLNRARVQRAWEVLTATGKGLAEWQNETPPPALPLEAAHAFVMKSEKEWLNDRIERRFEQMMEQGVLDEVRKVAPVFDPSLPAHCAIGAPELVSFVNGTLRIEEARQAVIVATRQYAKRQRTWFRSKMKKWQQVYV